MNKAYFKNIKIDKSMVSNLKRKGCHLISYHIQKKKKKKKKKKKILKHIPLA